MAIDWNPSHGPTLGVEWEVQLIDGETMDLRQEAGKVLGDLPVIGETGEHPRLRHELMQSTVEIVTGICSTVSEAKDDLAEMITELQRAAAPHGIVLACAGTHPVSDWRDATMAPIQRYAELVEQMQWLARRIQTFGVHVHVGISDGAKAIPIVNALTAYLPHFLALTASSPFWCGYDTGLASSRSVTFGTLPTSGPPPRLADWQQFEDYMDILLRAGTIRTIKEVWWDIRPHPDFGTVEVRMFDGTPTLREVGMVAALSQSPAEPEHGDWPSGVQCGNANELVDVGESPGKRSLFFVRDEHPGIGLAGDSVVVPINPRASRAGRCTFVGP